MIGRSAGLASARPVFLGERPPTRNRARAFTRLVGMTPLHHERLAMAALLMALRPDSADGAA